MIRCKIILIQKKMDLKKLSEWQVSRTSHTLRGFSDYKKGIFSQAKVNAIFTSTPIDLTNKNIKNDIVTQIDNLMLSDLMSSNEAFCKQLTALKEKVEKLTEKDLPKIVSITSKKKMKMSFSIIKFNLKSNLDESNLYELNLMIEIYMPCNFPENGYACPRKCCGIEGKTGCKLQWMLWPENIRKPMSDTQFQSIPQYHDIKIMGKSLTQPRKTACIGKPYKFSGTEHPMSEDPSR